MEEEVGLGSCNQHKLVFKHNIKVIKFPLLMNSYNEGG